MIKNNGFTVNQDSQFARYIIGAKLEPLNNINLEEKITDVNDAMESATKKDYNEGSKAEKAMQEIHLFLSNMSNQSRKPVSGLKKTDPKQI